MRKAVILNLVMLSLLLDTTTAISAAVVVAMAADKASSSKAPSAIEVIDTRGRQHVVTSYENGARFIDAGLPFDNNITDDYWDRSRALKTVIAVELHNPEDQARIRQNALDRGMREFDVEHAHIVLLIPLASLDFITFSQQRAQKGGQARSEVRLAGGKSFQAGGGFWKLYGKENIDSLGTAAFSADLMEIRSIRSLAPPIPLLADFGFFGTTEAPFRVTVTDTAGEVIILEKALYCAIRQYVAPDKRNTTLIRYGDNILTTVSFRAGLDVKVGGTSSLSIPASKLRVVTLGKVAHKDAGYNATAVLRTGESLEFTIIPSEVGIYVPNGILGASPKGWVWIPWYAVARLEFDSK